MAAVLVEDPELVVGAPFCEDTAIGSVACDDSPGFGFRR